MYEWTVQKCCLLLKRERVTLLGIILTLVELVPFSNHLSRSLAKAPSTMVSLFFLFFLFYPPLTLPKEGKLPPCP